MYLLIKLESSIKFVNIFAEYCTKHNHNRDEMKLLQGGMFVIFAIVSGEHWHFMLWLVIYASNFTTKTSNFLATHSRIPQISIQKVKIAVQIFKKNPFERENFPPRLSLSMSLMFSPLFLIFNPKSNFHASTLSCLSKVYYAQNGSKQHLSLNFFFLGQCVPEILMQSVCTTTFLVIITNWYDLSWTWRMHWQSGLSLNCRSS